MNPALIKVFSKSITMGMIVTLVTGFVPGAMGPVHAAPGDTVRISVDSSGVQGNAGSRRPAISGDGRFVVFYSEATNFPGGGGAFLRDVQTGQTTLIDTDGDAPSISYDGRFIAFETTVNRPSEGDTNDAMDIYVYDRQSGLSTRVSVDSSGMQANGHSGAPAISSNGRFVAFESDASNLVGDDTNGVKDVFVHDLQTGTTERVSLAAGGSQVTGASFHASISDDGNIVVFASTATDLVTGDTNGRTDAFVRDRGLGTTTRVSISSSGVQTNQNIFEPTVSANGRFISFASAATSLVTEETNSFDHVYVHDRQTGITTLDSRHSDGSSMIGDSGQSTLSGDGRYVAFQFDDRSDGLGFFEIFVRDRQTGALTSASPLAGGGNEDSSFSPMISANGQFVAFASNSNQLVSGDTNGTADVFRNEIEFVADQMPTVTSSDPLCPSTCSFPTPAGVSFKVIFSEAVTGVTIDDFALTATGGIAGASLIDVTGTGTTYTVNVNTGSGDGTLRVDVVDDDSILDSTSNPLGGTGAGNGNFVTGSQYTIDKSIPAVISSTRLDSNPNSAPSVNFLVTFSEPVTGVDVTDFTLAIAGGINSVAVSSVTGSGDLYTVTVQTGVGDGLLRLDVVDDDSIVDSVLSPLGGIGTGNGGFSTGEAYSIDLSVPTVISSLRADPNPSPGDSVHYNVTFSEPVTGVDAGDFTVTNTGGISGTSVLDVSGSGSTYVVTVGTGTGDGDVRLDVVDNDSILDAVGRPLGGTDAGNGNFTTGDTYTIKKSRIELVAADVRSNGANDGWVLESAENSNVGGTKNASATTFRLGDDAKDKQYRSILHFPTSYLPDNAVITQAILMIKIQGIAGTDPFTTHQNISVDIRSGYFGSSGLFGFNGLDLTDFQAPAHMNAAGVIQNNPVNGYYWSLLDTSSYQFINLQGTTQIRLMFQLDDNDDLADDYLTFFSGNANDLNDRPHLFFEYYVPR